MRNRQNPMMSAVRVDAADTGAGARASTPETAESKGGSTGSGGAVSLGERILRMLTAAGDDGVPTQAFIDTFDVEVTGADNYIFRDLLRELAYMERGVWKLKQSS